MSVAITANPAANSTATAQAAHTGAGKASLETQIARYQKELADCVNCSSAKTPEGKKTIEDISNKISAAKERIKQIQATDTVNHSAATRGIDDKTSTVAPDGSASTAATADHASAAKPASPYSTLGSVIDVFG